VIYRHPPAEARSMIASAYRLTARRLLSAMPERTIKTKQVSAFPHPPSPREEGIPRDRSSMNDRSGVTRNAAVKSLYGWNDFLGEQKEENGFERTKDRSASGNNY